jgi:serine/threonine-protein kinase RsbW
MPTPENGPQTESSNEFVLETSCRGSYLAQIRAAVADRARRCGFDEHQTAQIEVAVGEACSNIVQHAYAMNQQRSRQNRDPRIRLVIHHEPDCLVMELTDYGQRFDFANYRPTDIDRSLREMENGGYGVAIIRQFMDEVQYSSHHRDGNTLRMVKYLKKS